MKTYDHPARKYWTETVPMAEAAGIDPWLCVRHLTGIFGSDKMYFKQEYTDHPDFKLPEDKAGFTFALTVLEKVPVFIGSKVYHVSPNQNDGTCGEWEVHGVDELGNISFTNNIIKVMAGKIGIYFTWTPPTASCAPKKRTFMLELDEEEIEHLIWLTGNIRAFKSGLMRKRLTELRNRYVNQIR